MRTRTIYEALRQAEYRGRSMHLSHRERFYQLSAAEKRMQLKVARFEVELLRRMDERDEMRRELAEARAYISTIIDAPKDYPAEESA